MDTTHGRLGILLAGGRGARLGAGVPKALASCGGRTLWARAHATLADCTARVLVVAPAGFMLDVAPEDRVADPPGDTGPLGALVVGLNAQPFHEAFVLPVDLPGVTAATLRALADRRGDAPAVIAAHEGRPQPMVGVFAPTSVGPLERVWREGERSVTRAVLAAGARVVDASELPGGPADWLNVNTPEDLARASAHIASEGDR